MSYDAVRCAVGGNKQAGRVALLGSDGQAVQGGVEGGPGVDMGAPEVGVGMGEGSLNEESVVGGAELPGERANGSKEPFQVAGGASHLSAAFAEFTAASRKRRAAPTPRAITNIYSVTRRTQKGPQDVRGGADGTPATVGAVLENGFPAEGDRKEADEELLYERLIIPAFSRRRRARSVVPQVGAQAEAANGPVPCPAITPWIELASALPSNAAASSFGTSDVPTVRGAAPVATGCTARIRAKREWPGLKWRRRVRERGRLRVLLKRQERGEAEVKAEAETSMDVDVEAEAEVGGGMDVDAWGEIEAVAETDVDVDMEAKVEPEAEAEAEEMDVDESVESESRAESEVEVEGGAGVVETEPEVDVDMGVDVEREEEEEVQTPEMTEVEVVAVEVEAEAEAAVVKEAVDESEGEVEVQTGGEGEAAMGEEIEEKIEGDAKVEEAEPGWKRKGRRWRRERAGGGGCGGGSVGGGNGCR